MGDDTNQNEPRPEIKISDLAVQRAADDPEFQERMTRSFRNLSASLYPAADMAKIWEKAAAKQRKATAAALELAVTSRVEVEPLALPTSAVTVAQNHSARQTDLQERMAGLLRDQEEAQRAATEAASEAAAEGERVAAERHRQSELAAEERHQASERAAAEQHNQMKMIGILFGLLTVVLAAGAIVTTILVWVWSK